MFCKKCGCEVTDKSIKNCPKCGAKVNGLPTWAIVLIVLAIIFTVLPFALGILGVILAMTLPVLMSDTSSSQFRSKYLRTISSLNQALLMGQALNDDNIKTTDDMWNKGVKENISGVVEISGGIRLSNGVEIKYEKLRDTCEDNYSKNASESTACAILTIDVNGFDKAPNRFSTSAKISDRFNVLMYPTSTEPATGSEEDKILHTPRTAR